MRAALIILTTLLTLTSARAEEIVNWDTPEGIARFGRSSARVDFYPLVNQFECQVNGIFCGVASSVIVLNALRQYDESYTKPREGLGLQPEFQQYLPEKVNPNLPRYTQFNFFTLFPHGDEVEAVMVGKTVDGKRHMGLELRQLGELLQQAGLAVEIRPAGDDLSDQQIRQEIVTNLSTPGDYVIVNLHRQALHEKGGGHFSPLAAYDQESDSVLFLDVDPPHSPWAWIEMNALIRAMRTRDAAENRGYLLVRNR